MRAFSTTRSYQKNLVEFTPSSSPELDAILNQYRETLFIPSVLSLNHQRLIYRESRQGVLLNEPGVTVTLPNDEDIKLRPMKLTDRPVKAKALAQIIKALTSTQENDAWNNVFPFLVGMKVAKQTVTQAFLSQLIRKAYEQGKASLPLRCVQQADETNIRLCHREITREILLGCHKRAAASAFKGDELLSAAKHAENVALLLEKKEHCGGTLREGEVDMRQSLMVVGVLLEMTAAKAICFDAKKDVDAKVAGYVAKVLALSEAGFDEPLAVGQEKGTARLGHVFTNHLPLWHGMKLASRVEGAIKPEVRQTFNKHLQSLEKLVKDAESYTRSSEEHRPKRALQMYDQLKAL